MEFSKFKGSRPKRLRRRSTITSALCGVLIAIVTGVVLMAIQPARVESNSSTLQGLRSSETVMIPTPVRPIAKGERLRGVEFVQVAWPVSPLSASYIQDVSAYPDAIAAAVLPAHMPVPESAIHRGPLDLNAVVERIPSGMRAITVKVDAESAVEGWVRSGSYVDVILLKHSNERSSGIVAKVIAENVRILSAGRSTEPLSGQTSAPRAPATVTMLVSQEDALKIKTAASVGKLTFSLRGLGDQAPSAAHAIDPRELFGGSRTVLPEKERYRGRARGPDGKTYILGNDSQWVRTLGPSSEDSETNEAR